MSPIYNFCCDQCGYIDDAVLLSVDEYVGAYACNRITNDKVNHFGEPGTSQCTGNMRRVFNAPAIGKVSGSGGSPARGSL